MPNTFIRRSVSSSLVLFTVFSIASTAYGEKSTDAKQKKRRSQTVLFELKENADANQRAGLSSVLQRHGFIRERVLRDGKVNQARARSPKLATEEQLAAELLATGAVEFAEPDYQVPPDAIPNDPYLSSQWHHAKINSSAAWDVTTGNTTVKVGICDSGIQSSHPDLAPNLLLPGFNTADNTTNSEPVTHHGTMVAGFVGAVGNNGVGVAGLAWNVRLLPGRITNASDGWAYFSDMAECINWSANQGAKVVNLSYAGANSSTIDSAARYLRSKGGLLFMSAGNEGLDVSATYPDFTSFVLVGATTSTDSRASWSNFGTAIDIAAPGASVYTTYVNSSYTAGNGTSFASPIVAGVAALVYSINPSFTPAQVESILFSTALDIGALGEDSVFGHGRVDAGAAVSKAMSFTSNLAPEAAFSATPVSGIVPLNVAFNASASSDRDGQIVSYQWTFGDGSTASGMSVSHIYTLAGNYTATLTVTDDFGATSSTSVPIIVNRDPNAVAFVSRIEMTLYSSKRGGGAVAKVFVLDQSSRPLPGVTVSGAWSGLVSGSGSATTDVSGAATLTSLKTTKSGTITFTVNNITSTSHSYDPTRNVMVSGSIVK